MTSKKFFAAAATLALCVGASAGFLTSCVGYVATSRVGYVYEEDDYVYYPDYDVYYSQRRRDYIYLDGGSWRRHSSPSNVSVNVLFSSPSYRMDFHDSPEHHHSDMRRKYSRHGRDHDNNNGKDRDDDDHGKGHDKHKDKD